MLQQLEALLETTPTDSEYCLEQRHLKGVKYSTFLLPRCSYSRHHTDYWPEIFYGLALTDVCSLDRDLRATVSESYKPIARNEP